MTGAAVGGRFHGGHLLLAGLALLVILAGLRAVASLTGPLPRPPAMTPPALADRDLLARFDPFAPARLAAGAALPVTALPFSLHGIRADTATGRGSAIISAGDGQQAVFAVGDVIADGVTLAAIAPDHVVLERGGVREALWLDAASTSDPQGFVPPAGAEFVVPSGPAPSTGAEGERAMPTDVPDEQPLASEEPVFG